LDCLKKQRIFHADIKAPGESIAASLDAAVNGEVLKPYATVVVFGGKQCRQQDIDSIHAHFEKNGGIEFTYLENLHDSGDFIIGAY